ncbi:nitroreductase [Nocardioides humilatus]|uniref:Nitroreductase n=2 Tax=Nocardioides humilatus TaxID=2607660 RepID=A0A5B1LJE1_9ACTN|nr:nitroreductase [Nocardioides humilatus]
MSTMRAMRKLKPDPVPEDLLVQLVEAAIWGPSGSNAQAYSYVVVTDREQMAALARLWDVVATFYLGTAGKAVPDGMTEESYERMRAALRFQRDHFAETPAVIIPCYDLGPWQRKVMRNVGEVRKATFALGPRRAVTVLRNYGRFGDMGAAASVYPGVQNLLLTARALGLAATMTTWHQLIEAEFKQVLGIPRNVQTFAVIPIGYPAGRFGPVSRKPAADTIHWDRWAG